MTTRTLAQMIVTLNAATLLIGCPGPVEPRHDDPPEVESRSSAPPQWLMQGWIVVLAANAVTTYDFTQAAAAGLHAVQIRAWQQIGAMGWQSNQSFTAAFSYSAADQRISMQSATGYRDEWVVLERQSHAIRVRSLRNNTEYVWYNCSAQGWPALIYASMRGCR